MNSLMNMAVKHFADSGNVNQIQQQAAQQKPEDASLFSNALSMFSNSNGGQGKFEGLEDLNGDGVVDEQDLRIANERASSNSGQVDASTLGKAGLFSALSGMGGAGQGGQQQYGQQQQFGQQQQQSQYGQQQQQYGQQQQGQQQQQYGQQQHGQQQQHSSGAAGMLGSMMGGGGGYHANTNTSHTQQGGQGQNNLVAMAMAQAATMFDKKQQNGQVPQGATKQSAVNQAAGFAIKYLMKNGQSQAVTGGSGGASSLLNMAGKFMK